MSIMAVSVRLDTRRLDEIAAKLNTNTDRVIGALAFQVEGKAKIKAPVDTGALRSSIHTEQLREMSWMIADAVEYGIYQELGTRRMAAHPFMVPAAEEVGRNLNSGKTWESLFK